jgi:hypothetical protein
MELFWTAKGIHKLSEKAKALGKQQSFSKYHKHAWVEE